MGAIGLGLFVAGCAVTFGHSGESQLEDDVDAYLESCRQSECGRSDIERELGAPATREDRGGIEVWVYRSEWIERMPSVTTGGRVAHPVRQRARVLRVGFCAGVVCEWGYDTSA